MKKYMNKLTAGILAAAAALSMMIPTVASAANVPFGGVVPVAESVVPVTESVVPVPVASNTKNAYFHDVIPVELTFSGIDGNVINETIRIYGRRYQNTRRGVRLGKEELLLETTSYENKDYNEILGTNVDLDSVRIEYDYSSRYYWHPINQTVWLEDCVKDTDDLLSLTVGMYGIDGLSTAPAATMMGYAMCEFDYMDARGIYQIDDSIIYVNNG